MEILPQKLEAVILDGVLPENSDFLNKDVTSRRDAIKRYLEVCKNDSICNDAYPNLEDELLSITDTLVENPHQFSTTEDNITTNRIITSFVIFQKFFDLLYNRYYYGILPSYIHKIYIGMQDDDYSYLEYLSALYTDTVNSDNPLQSRVMSAFIYESENPLYINDMLSNYQSLGRYQNSIPIYNICLQNDRHTSYGGMDKLIEYGYDSHVPTLLLSGTLDPITPVNYGDNAAQRLHNSTHLIFHNQGHVPWGTACGKLAIETFIHHKRQLLSPWMGK